MKTLAYCKLKKVYSNFGEAINEIIKCKPQLEKIIITDEELRQDPSSITMEQFYKQFPDIINAKNPIETDENGKRINQLWEYHLSARKFHIKTNNYFSIGMNYHVYEGQDSFCFFITLFGNYSIDKEYLLDNGWEVQDEGE
jgi:hypothetical protein